MEHLSPLLDDGLLGALLETVSAPVVVLDAEARVQFFNAAAERSSGHPRQEVLGEEAWFLVDPDDRSRARELFRKLWNEDGPPAQDLEVAWLSRDSGRRPLAWTVTTVRDQANEPRWLVCTGRDLTRLRELEDQTRELLAEDALRQVREDALRASEARVSGIVELATDAIISMDEDQRITLFNQGAEAIFGWSSEDMLGRPLDVLLPERVRERHHRHVHGFGASEERARIMGERQRISGLRKSGEEFPAEASIIRFEVDGEKVYTVVLRDVTDRHRAQAEQRFLAEVGQILASSLELDQTLSNLAESAVGFLADYCAVDLREEDGTIRRIEVAARKGIDPGPARLLQEISLDRSRPHLMHAVLESGEAQMVTDVTPELLESLAQGDRHLQALRDLNAGSYMVVPLVAGDRQLGTLLLVASGEREPYDERTLELAREVGARAGMAVYNARLYRDSRRAIQARDDILAVVSHDLGNPLQAIFIGLEALERRVGSRGSGGAEGNAGAEGAGPEYYLSAMRRSAELMQRLIHELLEVRRMEEGHLSLDRRDVHLRPLVHEALELVEPLARVKEVTLLDRTLEQELPPVTADPDAILKVLSNLVGNAVKHTPQGGRVSVGVAILADELQVSVRDTGSGIPESEVDLVFDRFWRAERTGGKGIGLGLAIAKGIVKAHGGRIGVESAVGSGSTFHFSLPLA